MEERESGLASQSGVRGEGGGDDVRCVVLLCVCVSVGGRLTPVFHRSGRAWGWRSVGDCLLEAPCEKTRSQLRENYYSVVVGYTFFAFLVGGKKEQLDQESQRHDLNYGRGRLGTPNCPVN